MAATSFWNYGAVLTIAVLSFATSSVIASSAIQYKYFPQEQTWKDAKSKCEQIGFVLATPRNAEENGAMIKYLETASGGNDEIWFGGTLDDANKWRWSDGTSVEWTDWASTQPNDLSREKCIRFRRDDAKWWNRQCTRSFPHVCQLEGSREARFGLLIRDQIPSTGLRDSLTLSSGAECTLRCLADYDCKKYSIQTLSPQAEKAKYLCKLFSSEPQEGELIHQENTRLYFRDT